MINAPGRANDTKEKGSGIGLEPVKKPEAAEAPEAVLDGKNPLKINLDLHDTIDYQSPR